MLGLYALCVPEWAVERLEKAHLGGPHRPGRMKALLAVSSPSRCGRSRSHADCDAARMEARAWDPPHLVFGLQANEDIFHLVDPGHKAAGARLRSRHGQGRRGSAPQA